MSAIRRPDKVIAANTICFGRKAAKSIRISNLPPFPFKFGRGEIDLLSFSAAERRKMEAYNDSLSIAERLAKSDPSNAGWLRDLSASYDEVGDVQTAQGDLAGALRSYNDSLAIRERLAKSDPGNAGWQHDLSASYYNLGNIRAAQGDLVWALSSYNDSLAIMERLAKSDHARYNTLMLGLRKKIEELKR